jgi:hypothetical protein
MRNVWILAAASLGAALAATTASGQAALPADAELTAPAPPVLPGQIASWDFHPARALPAPHDAVGQPPVAEPARTAGLAPRATAPRLWFGAEPTDRRTGLLVGEAVPQGPFTVSMWVTYHVNHPVGAAVIAADPSTDAPAWTLGFEHGTVVFSVGGTVLRTERLEVKGSTRGQDLSGKQYRRGALRYWHHLTGVSDGATLTLWHNGEKIAQGPAPRGARPSAATQVDVAAYTASEPHMALGDLVRHVGVWSRALTPAEIAADFAARVTALERGVVQPGRLHFTSGGPLLQATSGPARLLWETDRPAAAVVEWGESEQLGQGAEIAADARRIRTFDLPDLKADTVYRYRVTVTDGAERVATPVFTFRTAPPPGAPVVFAAISDTEARPHVNAHVGTLVWRETPQFVINAGDLTDGGKLPHRAEWTHEYLAALAPLMARVPVLPVMGNGEDDIVWYDRYHANDGPEPSYYAWRWGDVEVFTLDSNLDVRDRTDPGFRTRQTAWLRGALASSTARWKVVTFHHPPLSEQYAKVTADFMPLLEAAGVDLVLVGHHHSYLRSWPLVANRPAAYGPIVVQLGNGGGNVSGRAAAPDPRWAKSYQGFGYAMVRIHGDRLEFAMHDDAGALRDRFDIVKPAAPR